MPTNTNTTTTKTLLGLLGSFSVALVLLVPAVLQARTRIVTTIPDLGAIAKEVGGERVDVTSLVRPTQDPHFLDAKPSFVVALNRADLVLLAGMELEAGWLPPLLVAARNSRIQQGTDGYLDCSTLIPPMEVQAADRSKGDIHPGGNPHYWNDPRNGIRLANGIAQKLARIDPGNASGYQSGALDFVRRLEARMQQWRAQLDARKGTKVVVYHRSWVYLLDYAGYVEAGALEPKPGIPPSPNHVASLIRQVQGQDVRYVIQESFYPTQLSRVFAQKSGAKLVVLPTMVGADGTSTYADVVGAIVNAITQ
ncbi:MAG: metal ABC transporter substrate-binding protein [Pseudomonadota bacterium]